MVGLDNPIHLLFLLVIVLLIFGAKRLPEMGRSLGSGMRGFKDSLNGENTAHSLTGENTAQVSEEHAAEPPLAQTKAIESRGLADEVERASVADELKTRTAA